MSKYGYAKQVSLSFDQAIEKTIKALQTEGFGVLTDIDVKQTLKKKLDVDFKNYRILGACNPAKAYQVLQDEEEIGLLLPCNVIVYEQADKVIISALLPTKIFSIIDNSKIEPLAEEVEVMLKKVIDSI